MTPQQDYELLGTLEASVKSLETQVKGLAGGRWELRGEVDRLLYTVIGIGTAVIAAMAINQVPG